MRYLGEVEPLPSQQSAQQLVSGDWGALPLVVLHTLGRAALIAGGLKAVGVKKHNLLKYSVGGAMGIEAFVIAWFAYQNYKEKTKWQA